LTTRGTAGVAALAEEGTPMLRVVTDDESREDLASTLDEIVREGARRMLLAALEAEVEAYIDTHSDQRDAKGHRLVVRNGHAEARTITTAAGAIEIEAPRVNDKRIDPGTGERCRFRSSIIPPWCRKSPKVAEVLPLMYLHGMSTGDFAPALAEFFGSGAGLSPSRHYPAHPPVAGRARRLRPPRPVRRRLRLRLGRRRALQRPP
jgi:putative transposase